MPYNASQFQQKTNELLTTIYEKRDINKGFVESLLYTPTAVVDDLIAYINANPADPQTFGYEQQGGDLFIKPLMPLSIKLYRI
jgi:hypothetical protein